MWKKMSVFLSFVVLIFNFCNISFADSGSYIFNDNSFIADDLEKLGLDVSDYILKADSNYDKTDIIAISESYLDNGNFKSIVNYVYFYNPCRLIDDVEYISVKYNDSILKTSCYLVSYYSLKNISKYKIDLKVPSLSDIEREYCITGYSDKKDSYLYNFDCVFKQDGSNIDLNYDSYIFITGKELFDYVPYVDWTEKKKYVSNDLSEYYEYDNNASKSFWTCSSEYDYILADFVFLNFDTNKEIDCINEIDLSFKLYSFWTENDWWFNEFEDRILSVDKMPVSELELVDDYSSNYLTLYNDNNTFKRQSNINNWDSLKCPTNFHNFEVPSKNRLNNFSNSDFYDNLREEKLLNSSSGYSARESFENRQCSILIDILPVAINYYTNFVGEYLKYTIRDLSVMRINYTTGMKVYNARCNSGALIDSVNSNIVPKTWWDVFIEWFTDNFPYSVLIIGGVILGLPLIVTLVVNLVTSGGSAIVSSIGKIFASIFKGIFKLFGKILLLPFKFLEALFSPKKNDKKK